MPSLGLKLSLPSRAVLGGSGAPVPKNTLRAVRAVFVLAGFAPNLVDHAPTAYSLTASPGVFALSGVGMTPVVDHALPANAGVFTCTGQAANLVDTPAPGNYVLSAAVGTFTETGVATGLLRTRIMPAVRATFALTGVAATLTDTPPGGGSIAIAQTNAANTPSTTSFTSGKAAITGQSLGTVGSSTVIAVAVAVNGAITAISSVKLIGTFAGSPLTLTQAPGAFHQNGTNATDIWYGVVPAGATTAEIDVLITGSPSRCTALLYNITSAGGFSAATGANVNNTSNAISGTLTVPSSGGAIGIAYEGAAGSSASGMSVTDISSGSIAGAHWVYAGHDVTNTGSQTFTVTFGGANSVISGSWAAFSP